MITARQKILAHLKKIRAASAREIARALKMSAPNVRHHLGILTSDGRLEVTSVHQRGGRGRPEKIYSLSQSALGDNLSVLADALLTEAGSTLRQGSGQGLNIEGIAGRILDSSQFANMPITKRLALLIKKLDEMHYQARWEAGAEGPRVILGRCPYAKVIADHPELCKMDVVILGISLGRPIIQLQKSEADARGACPFLFQVG
ncbi:MAG: helix-turn-helix domain-containing protein [Anaerolineales bacterium]|nr:helix-turn-helix domain-containing protein [Anaerolineales bacterium]